MHGTSRKTTRLYHGGRWWNREEGEELKHQKEYNR